MELLSAIMAVLLFSLACNLDTVILAVGYTVKGVHISCAGTLVIALVTTVVTWMSLALGDVASGVLSPAVSELLGGLVLIGIGLWFLLDYLRHIGREAPDDTPGRSPNLWGCVSLAAALAVNNAGVGVAAGMAGIGTLAASVGNFIITLAALPLGRWLGARVAGRFLGRYALPLSGVLLVVLGVWEALS